MADSLDDFFAKKDKKRGKDKGKAALSAVSLVRELEEGAKHADFNVRKDNKPSTAIEMLGIDANDNDWKDFEEVEQKDYTGLKVKEMSLQDQADEELRRLAAEQAAEAGPEPAVWGPKKDKDEPQAPQATVSAPKETASASQNAKPSAASDSVAPTDDASKDAAASTVSAAAAATTAAAAAASASAGMAAPAAGAASSSAATPSSSTTGQEPATKDGENNKDGNAPATDKAEPEKKSDKPSAKYVPPGQRRPEVQTLEPIKLSQTRG